MRLGVSSPESSRLSDLRAQVDSVKAVMAQNIDKVVQRGDKLEDLSEKSDLLRMQAVSFKKASGKFHGRGALMSAIRDEAPLKKKTPPMAPVPPAVRRTAAAAAPTKGKGGGRGALLSSIKSGVALKKTESKPAPPEELSSTGMADALAQALSMRTTAVAALDDESWDDSDEDDDWSSDGGGGGGGGGPAIVHRKVFGVVKESQKDKEKLEKAEEEEEEEESYDDMGYGLFDDDAPFEVDNLYSEESSGSDEEEGEEEGEGLFEEFEGKEFDEEPVLEGLSQLSQTEINKLFGAQNMVDYSWAMKELQLCSIDPEKVTNLLIKAGAKSLGSTVYTALLKLVATLLILKFLSLTMADKYPIAFSPKVAIEGTVDPKHSAAISKAVQFAVKTDSAYPSLYSRLELGFDWQSVLNRFLRQCRKS